MRWGYVTALGLSAPYLIFRALSAQTLLLRGVMLTFGVSLLVSGVGVALRQRWAQRLGSLVVATALLGSVTILVWRGERPSTLRILAFLMGVWSVYDLWVLELPSEEDEEGDEVSEVDETEGDEADEG